MDDNNANDDDYDNDDNAMNLELHHHLYRGSEATYDTLVNNNEIMALYDEEEDDDDDDNDNDSLNSELHLDL